MLSLRANCRFQVRAVVVLSLPALGEEGLRQAARHARVVVRLGEHGVKRAQGLQQSKGLGRTITAGTHLSAAQCGPPLAKQHRLVQLVGLGARAQPRHDGVALEHVLSSQEGPRRVEGARRGHLSALLRVDEDLTRHAPLGDA